MMLTLFGSGGAGVSNFTQKFGKIGFSAFFHANYVKIEWIVRSFKSGFVNSTKRFVQMIEKLLLTLTIVHSIHRSQTWTRTFAPKFDVYTLSDAWKWQNVIKYHSHKHKQKINKRLRWMKWKLWRNNTKIWELLLLKTQKMQVNNILKVVFDTV